MAELVYVTHTCRKCKCAFVDVDEVYPNETEILDIPADYKYCEACVEKGFKNTVKNKDEFIRQLKFDQYLDKRIEEEKIDDPEDIDFIERKCKEILKENKQFKRKMSDKTVVNQAIEILGYMKLEE